MSSAAPSAALGTRASSGMLRISSHTAADVVYHGNPELACFTESSGLSLAAVLYRGDLRLMHATSGIEVCTTFNMIKKA